MQELMTAIANGKGNSVDIIGIIGIVLITAINKGYRIYERNGSKPLFTPTEDAEKQLEIIEDSVVG